eukprot:contig_33754_g8147
MATGRDMIDVAGPDGETPLYAAATNGHAGIVDVLLSGGASVNAAKCNGYTPL